MPLYEQNLNFVKNVVRQARQLSENKPSSFEKVDYLLKLSLSLLRLESLHGRDVGIPSGTPETSQKEDLGSENVKILFIMTSLIHL